MAEEEKTKWYVWVIGGLFALLVFNGVIGALNQPTGLEGFVEESEKFKE